MVLTEQHKSLIEKIGIYYEGLGMQPAAARVLGLLYLAEKPELTFEEITTALNISKSATSNAINLLLQTGHLDYITFSGDRKRYFRLKVSNWREGFSKKIGELTNFNILLNEVLALRTKDTVAYNNSIKEMASFMNYMHKQLPILLERWEKENK